jgi:hypothetical protein
VTQNKTFKHHENQFEFVEDKRVPALEEVGLSKHDCNSSFKPHFKRAEPDGESCPNSFECSSTLETERNSRRCLSPFPVASKTCDQTSKFSESILERSEKQRGEKLISFSNLINDEHNEVKNEVELGTLKNRIPEGKAHEREKESNGHSNIEEIKIPKDNFPPKKPTGEEESHERSFESNSNTTLLNKIENTTKSNIFIKKNSEEDSRLSHAPKLIVNTDTDPKNVFRSTIEQSDRAANTLIEAEFQEPSLEKPLTSSLISRIKPTEMKKLAPLEPIAGNRRGGGRGAPALLTPLGQRRLGATLHAMQVSGITILNNKVCKSVRFVPNIHNHKNIIIKMSAFEMAS